MHGHSNYAAADLVRLAGPATAAGAAAAAPRFLPPLAAAALGLAGGLPAFAAPLALGDASAPEEPERLGTASLALKGAGLPLPAQLTEVRRFTNHSCRAQP